MASQELDKLLSKFLEEDDPNLRMALYQQFLRTKEALSETAFKQSSSQNILYPHLDDPLFARHIASKKEFQDNEQEDILYDPQTRGDELSKMEFELAPHQQFVRNFLSSQTPYNSLLLFHGLGTGKTCSAISVCEEMREYMNQIGDKRRILIVASPNVQGNFRRQLFDARKLKNTNGVWSMRSCTGNQFLQEINPMQIKGMTREMIEKQVDKLIKQSYVFMGYQQFGNYIQKLIQRATDGIEDEQRAKQRKINILKREFSSRMIVIDEVHNIRISDDNANKQVAQMLLEVINHTEAIKLLLLSATPMFNNYREILWLVNLMNLNDKRSRVRPRDVFTKSGEFVVKDGVEVGKQLLLRKSRGYISYVRGENPYSFPYRIFPSDFDPDHTFRNLEAPTYQVNGKEIEASEQLQYIDVYLNNLASYQEKGYDYIIQEIKDQFPSYQDVEKGLGYQALNTPVQALNMLYPSPKLDKYIRKSSSTKKPEIRDLVGKRGLQRVMNYTSHKTQYAYKPEIVERYGRIFEQPQLAKYSAKITGAIENMKRTSTVAGGKGGIILMYSEYIDGGCVPIALALEEMGFRRYKGHSSLLKEPKEGIDALTFIPKSQFREEEHGRPFQQASYVMITGDSELSPQGRNDIEVKASTASSNLRGEEVRVIIMSKAGSEGLDFRLIRQVHIMDPWFNMNRIEQIIGRAVRTFSHIDLPFEERNVQIYLYASLLSTDIEAVDVYVYRLAERKAVQVGVVARLLKENAVDCRLNYPTTSGLTAEVFQQEVDLTLSTGDVIQYQIGDKPFSSTCDYMETCAYRCLPYVSKDDDADIMASHRKERQELQATQNMDTYNEHFISKNTDKLKRIIARVVGSEYIVSRQSLLRHMTRDKKYPQTLLSMAIQQMVESKQEVVMDKHGRSGYVVNLGNYYVFQPIELGQKALTYTQRARPLDITFDHVEVSVPSQIGKSPAREAREEREDERTDGEDGMQEENKSLEKALIHIAKARRVETLKAGEKNWYTIASNIVERLSKPPSAELAKQLKQDIKPSELPTIASNTLMEYVFAHYFETLTLPDKLELLRAERPDSDSLGYVYRLLQSYIEKYRLSSNNNKKHAFYLYDEANQENLYIQERGWSPATPMEIEEFTNGLGDLKYDLDEFSKYIGFITLFKGKEYVFKVKKLEYKGHKGARCDQANKSVVLDLMNMMTQEIYGKYLYSEKDTKKLSKPQLCVEFELLLRYYQDVRDKVWFMRPEVAIANKIEKAYRKA